MNTIPAPSLTLVPREEWPDADFDLPDDDVPLHTHCDKYDDNNEDWDLEMHLGKTGGATVKPVFTPPKQPFQNTASRIMTIRPPLPQNQDDDGGDGDDDDEGLSTIKVAAFPKNIFHSVPSTQPDDDIEAAFALPSDLSCLSLAPLSLNHRSSKTSLEWGDKDHTSSSQSSDAYSSLGFADASPSSNSTSSVSLPNSETDDNDDEDDEGELEGLVIPTGLFESGHGSKHLTKILESKKRAQLPTDQVKVATPDPEDNFEVGLIIDDDVDLSPSRLLVNTRHQKSQHSSISRSYSMPPRPTTLRPPSRLRADRPKSPSHPPPSSARHFNKLRLSPSPPLSTATRSQTFQALAPAATPPSSFLTPKPASLRGQKSHSGLKPPTPPVTQRKFARKASLSSLMEASQIQASGSGSTPAVGSSTKFSRYEIPTAASRAKLSKKSPTCVMQEHVVPPTRPSTPSSNPAALRLTMPTLSRTKSRPGLSAVFSSVPPVPPPCPPVSPLPPCPPSNTSTRARTMLPPSNQTKVLRKPKRPRTYGDGTELDAIDDLPTDREKEGRFRVQPKGYGNRVPGGSYSSKTVERGLHKKGKRSGSSENTVIASAPTPNTTKWTERIQLPSKRNGLDIPLKKNFPSPCHPPMRRKPTLIRNLGGAGAPKVVGDMKWNPQILRWEGNDHVLRDFDVVVGTSTRPALITHLTGSSIGSPVSSFAPGARVVGNMIFDPSRMCWISTLPPEDDEPDVFANLADDEEDSDSWETKGGTIRACLQSTTLSSSDTSGSSISSTMVEIPSPSQGHSRTLSDSSSDRGSRASIVCNLNEALLASCRLSEERHCMEMKGWKMRHADVFAEPDRSYLYEIRALATRQY